MPRVSATPALSGKERRRVGGKSRRRSPHGLGQGRTSDAKPSSIVCWGRSKEMSVAADCARSLAIALLSPLSDFCALGTGFRGPAHSLFRRGPLCPLLRHGTKGGVLCFPIRRCEGTLYGAPFRRLAELVGFGNRGMRDCAIA
jgi:hypothetical protein